MSKTEKYDPAQRTRLEDFDEETLTTHRQWPPDARWLEGTGWIWDLEWSHEQGRYVLKDECAQD